ncbi:DUF397 domain-containing protein [Thermomonospora curvata]|uniref:DUF397 domain-containing protein n=1 Tax=Thermomonospora curvata (strain ATCC 19995 / DSM 43183 / JCM 3096 / KCTC 9072 / NBRC 15933 / NCIMB 10081 / Henssen B9) TaxID=471852 RepID=D1A796_THECD|nr:DUF397 domain-containing protein [Thermomonospora curvata]ACZ00302.1 protein of unknown function DUF397 [Thermomonospora curvata DSM 43183]
MTQWRKSSHSGTNNGGMSDCVEVANIPSGIAIRDSKNPHAGHLTLTPGVFADLLARLKRDG